MWFLKPPTLAMLSGLAVRNGIDDVGWRSGRLRLARLVWASFVLAGTGLAAALVGSSAGQHQLPELTMLLAAGTFGLATLVGRGSASLGAGCLVVVVGSTRELHALSPADLWDRLQLPGQVACGAVATVCVVGYGALGPRRSRASPAG
jgi:hypothetical protein